MSEKTLTLLLMSAGFGICELALWGFGATPGMIALKTWFDLSAGATAFRVLAL